MKCVLDVGDQTFESRDQDSLEQSFLASKMVIETLFVGARLACDAINPGASKAAFGKLDDGSFQNRFASLDGALLSAIGPRFVITYLLLELTRGHQFGHPGILWR